MITYILTCKNRCKPFIPLMHNLIRRIRRTLCSRANGYPNGYPNGYQEFTNTPNVCACPGHAPKLGRLLGTPFEHAARGAPGAFVAQSVTSKTVFGPGRAAPPPTPAPPQPPYPRGPR